MKKVSLFSFGAPFVLALFPAAAPAAPRRVVVAPRHVVVAPRRVVVAPRRVYVRVAPPRAIVEIRPARPSAAHVWIGGCHRWNGTAYVWVPGRWELGPRPGAAWVAGHWSHDSGGWFWVEGHWRTSRSLARDLAGATGARLGKSASTECLIPRCTRAPTSRSSSARLLRRDSSRFERETPRDATLTRLFVRQVFASRSAPDGYQRIRPSFAWRS